MTRHLPTIALLTLASAAEPDPWDLHWIHPADTSDGADGVRLGDFNDDGLPDFVTGFEEAGATRIFLHPGHEAVTRPWPSIELAPTARVEDACPVDLDRDGQLDVVVSLERGGGTVAFFAPRDSSEDWTRRPLSTAGGMYGSPTQLDGRHGPDLVVGGKRQPLRWLEAPADPREGEFTGHVIGPATWIMSLETPDMDGDGDADVLVSDRDNQAVTGVIRWFENPGPGAEQHRPWTIHTLLEIDPGVPFFLGRGDLDGDGREDLAITVNLGQHQNPAVDEPLGTLELLHRLDDSGRRFRRETIRLPLDAPPPKSVAIGDLDRDGDADLAIMRALGVPAGRQAHAAMWIERDGDAWRFHPIFDRGVKFDRVELLDLDGDGHLDLLSCEERALNGVFWLRNPLGDG